MMTAEKVRLSILQQAIQGKLTKQCHNENAIDHLKRIHAYNKSIQEQDFEIPDNWAWAKLADLTTDDSLNDGNWILSKDMSTVGTINLIQLGSVGDCVFKPKDYKRITEKKFDELQCREIYPGYLLINRLIGDRLLSCILPQIEGRLITAVDVCWVAPQPRMYNLKYIMYMCASPFFQSQVKALGHGTTRFRISKTNLINIAFPYPPIEEQARIVDLFESVEPYLVKCEEAERHLVLLNASFPEMMKKSILQEAVQGKLVPQDPNDEPASLLLKKIAEEKKRLIKEGKIKKQKPLPEITEDEIPFDIPENWEWAYLIDCVIDVADIDHKMPVAQTSGIPYISPLNFTSKGIDFESAKYISEEDYDRLSRKCKPERDDIIFPRYGTIGVLRLIDVDRKFLVSYSSCVIKTSKQYTYPKYIYYALQSPQTKQEINKYINKTTQPNVGMQSIKQFLFPLPPFEEQKRIVERTEALLDIVEKIK